MSEVALPPTDPHIKEAREIALRVWAETYEDIKEATDLEYTIMDEAHDLVGFAAESDTRTATILLVSFLEDTIKKTFCDQWKISSKRDIDRYFGSNGPLSTFSQRALVANGIGWLTNKQVSELDTLRKIRNDFAHNHRVHSLSSPELKDLCLSLQSRDEIWFGNESYKRSHDAASDETKLKLRVYCAGIFIISDLLGNAKMLKRQLPAGYKPSTGWDSLLRVQQGLTDAAIKYCWISLGFKYTGMIYKSRRKSAQKAQAQFRDSEGTPPQG